jgi:dUTP pyrophosphatase
LDKPLTIAPGEIAKIPTGLAIAPSRKDIAICIFPRSGLSTKHGITLANSVGLVDSDYRGELMIPLINHGAEAFTVESGMRVAQLVVLPILIPQLREVTALDETERGAGGFGASGLS